MPKTERADPPGGETANDLAAGRRDAPNSSMPVRPWRLQPPRPRERPCQVLHRLATGRPRGSVPTLAGSTPGGLTQVGGDGGQGRSRAATP
jgi:hypothetical protein